LPDELKISNSTKHLKKKKVKLIKNINKRYKAVKNSKRRFMHGFKVFNPGDMI